jgi:hypothetical protein
VGEYPWGVLTFGLSGLIQHRGGDWLGHSWYLECDQGHPLGSQWRAGEAGGWLLVARGKSAFKIPIRCYLFSSTPSIRYLLRCSMFRHRRHHLYDTLPPLLWELPLLWSYVFSLRLLLGSNDSTVFFYRIRSTITVELLRMRH